MKIAFIGVGVMGQGMVRNLMKKGHELHIFSRTMHKAQEVISEGAIWHDSVAECVSGCPVIITIVGYPKDVEEVYFAANGILAAARKGSIVIDMTTTSPLLARRIYEEAKNRDIRALDAPVSGGDSGARLGTLTVMAGGDRDAFDECLGIFESMGSNIRYEGAAGNGQHTKMANQIAIAGAIAGVCEAIEYGKKAGLDTGHMLETIASGAAGSWQMSNNGKKIVQNDFDPGFYIKHFIKDMAIAQEEAAARSARLPVLETVLNLYRELERQGLGDLGTQALIKAYQ